MAGMLFIFCRLLHIPFSTSAALITFFLSLTGSFLFFYFTYQQILFKRLEETIRNLKRFNKANARTGKYDFTDDTDDPIERLNEEIHQLATDREKEIEHLKRLENYRKEFLGNVSHELKTPIFNIQGYVSTLIDGGINDPSINIDYLKKADRSVDRMIHIIDDLETISQLESGSLELDLEKYDILAQCKDICEQMEISARKKNITLSAESTTGKGVKVFADKFRIRQVLANLVSNSLKYGIENGQTKIIIEPVGKTIQVAVTDNGIGIHEEHLPRIFERFYRVDKGRSREQGGTGLGLSIVKHILEAHDQTIRVSSKPGEGTTFIFTLPKS